MGWTTPATWNPGQIVSATDLNTHLRDNMNYVGTGRPKMVQKVDNNADYTTTSPTFVDAHATNLAATITTNGGAVQVSVTGMYANPPTAGAGYFDVAVDGTRIGSAGADGLCRVNPPSGSPPSPFSFTVIVTGLSAAAHTFKLQWKVASGTGTLYGGNGTAGQDFIPVLSVEEIG